MAAEAPAPTELQFQPTVWEIGEGDAKVTLVQDKLTFFEKNEFLGIVAQAMDAILEQGGMAGLLSAMSMSQDSIKGFASGDFEFSSLTEAVDLISLLLKLLGNAPGLMEDAYMVILSIDGRDRERFRRWMRINIDDDTGFGIFETFIVQNEKTLRSFLPQWIERFKMARQTLYPELSASSQAEENSSSPISTD